MEDKTNWTGVEAFTVSVEEFDALGEGTESAHEFSSGYRRKKEKMLKAYQRRVCRSAWGGWAKAAAVFLLALSTPAIVSVASGSGFFGRIWGTSGKENVESHEEVVEDAEKGTSYTVTYPKREYTDEGLAKAEELMGEGVSFNSVVKEIGDTRLTVLGAAYDGNAAVVDFTLEREGGAAGSFITKARVRGLPKTPRSVLSFRTAAKIYLWTWKSLQRICLSATLTW